MRKRLSPQPSKDSKTLRAEAIRLLVDAHLRKTGGRIAVLVVLLRAQKPYSVEDIARDPGARGVHLVTLYRMLAQFVERGIVYQTDLRERHASFEIQRTHHHHIVCTVCGLREDVRVCPTIPERRAMRGSKHFNTSGTHTLEFFSVCRRCAKANAKTQTG